MLGRAGATRDRTARTAAGQDILPTVGLFDLALELLALGLGRLLLDTLTMDTGMRRMDQIREPDTLTRSHHPIPESGNVLVQQGKRPLLSRGHVLVVGPVDVRVSLLPKFVEGVVELGLFLNEPFIQDPSFADEAGALSLVDGAHAPGQIDLDLAAVGADFYVGNCHKWQCAPKGAAFLHAQPAQQAALHATVTSWGYAEGTGGHAGFDAYLGHTPFERRLQWQGTRDLSAWLTVPAALDFQQRHDWPAVRTRCHALAAAALDTMVNRFGLPPLGADDDWAQMVTLPVPTQDPDRLRARLFEESGIEIPVTTHAGRVFVRLSVQGYNTEADVARLLEAPALR